MGFGLLISSVNFGTSSLSNAEQLAGPDCNFLHLKGVEVFCNSAFPLHSDTFMVMPHISWQLSLILFSWTSIQRLPLLSLQEAHTLFLYFLQAVLTDTSSVSEHEMQFPEAVFRSESCTFSLDDSEEVWSSVLFELPAAVLSSRSMVALVGLEGDWPVPALVVQRWSQFPVSIHVIPHYPVQSCVHSQLWLLGSQCGSSCYDYGQVNCWKSGPAFSVWRWLGTQQMGTPLGECP